MLFAVLFAFLCGALVAQGTAVTIRNDVSRLDTSGNIIDCHSGMILYRNGLYYQYGEHYGNVTGFGPSPPLMYPKIVVYTSPDMEAWTFRGFALEDWPTKPYGTFFVPFVVFNEATQQFVLWFNAYLQGCCAGGFGVANSTDGIHFSLVSLNETGKYQLVDGNALMVDDDGAGYIVYTSELPLPDNATATHMVSIERLTPDYLHLAGENYGLFPDVFVEGAILYKRKGVYYVSFGSCCCFCRGGSGVVVYSAHNIQGPWTRQPYDLNCQGEQEICGAYGQRTNGPLTISAQGIGLSTLTLTGGDTLFLWQGERWVSAPNNNATCADECHPCVEPANYIKGNGFSYWIPLDFDDSGALLPFAPFVDSFTIDVPTTQNSPTCSGELCSGL